MELVRVEAPHFVAGLVFENNICTEAAPILKWAIGSSRRGLKAYFNKRNYSFETIAHNDKEKKMNEQTQVTATEPTVLPVPLQTDLPIGHPGTEERVFVQTPEDVGTEDLTVH